MDNRRLFLVLSFLVIVLLVCISGVLIFFERGGSAAFQILGQQFSSSNIGLAVLFLATLMFLYILREFTRTEDDSHSPSKKKLSSSGNEDIKWDEVLSGSGDLVLQLTAARGFRPDLIIGLCGGGLIVADVLCKKLGHIPCISLWANRHSRKENLLFSGPASRVNKYEFDEIFREGGVDRVLLVDDVVHSGHTLKEAVEFITANSKLLQSNEVELRTAALFFLTSATFKPDFIALSHSRVARRINVLK